MQLIGPEWCLSGSVLRKPGDWRLDEGREDEQSECTPPTWNITWLVGLDCHARPIPKRLIRHDRHSLVREQWTWWNPRSHPVDFNHPVPFQLEMPNEDRGSACEPTAYPLRCKWLERVGTALVHVLQGQADISAEARVFGAPDGAPVKGGGKVAVGEVC